MLIRRHHKLTPAMVRYCITDTCRSRNQEAQLSQRGRATGSVVETLKCSLEVTQGNGTIRKLGYGFVFAFHSNYGRIFSRFDTMHERDRQQEPRYAVSLDCCPSHGKNDSTIWRNNISKRIWPNCYFWFLFPTVPGSRCETFAPNKNFRRNCAINSLGG